MRILRQWTREGSSRKRAAVDDDESDQEGSRKRTKNNNNNLLLNGGRKSIENAGANQTEIGIGNLNEEYKIRGNSHINKKDFLSHSSSQSPTSTTPLTTATATATESSRPSPSIHPDRLENILNPDPNHTHASAASPNKRANLLNPLPQALEQISKVESEEHRRK